jgi:HEAT repeat protein
MLIRHNTWAFSFSLIGIVLAISVLLLARPQQDIAPNEIDILIKNLWSSDNIKREASKERLMQLGQVSIEPLMMLLNDILSDRRPRFVTGKESEGSEAWHRFKNISLEDDSIQDREKLKELEITSRLKNDALALLGRLQAEQAVPLIVEFLGAEEPVLSKRAAERRALTDMGAIAVPRLIHALENAERIAACERSAHTTAIPEDIRQRAIKAKTIKIQSRVADVLAEIGDPRALPALINLLNTSNDKYLTSNLQESINRLRIKSNQ